MGIFDSLKKQPKTEAEQSTPKPVEEIKLGPVAKAALELKNAQNLYGEEYLNLLQSQEPSKPTSWRDTPNTGVVMHDVFEGKLGEQPVGPPPGIDPSLSGYDHQRAMTKHPTQRRLGTPEDTFFTNQKLDPTQKQESGLPIQKYDWELSRQKHPDIPEEDLGNFKNTDIPLA